MSSRPSSLVLIFANLLPIAGVLWLDWQVFEILLLYWTESVIIGAVNVLRMLSSKSTNPLAGMLPASRAKVAEAALEQASVRIPTTALKIFVVPFFAIHYGMFCYGHLSAVVGLFSDSGLGDLGRAIPALSEHAFWIAVAAIAFSHLFSYLTNFLGKGEYKTTGVGTLMSRPYGRIVAMHVAIIFGGFFVVWLGNPLPMLLILIAAKTALDIRLHNKERQKFADIAGNDSAITM